jgi:2-oxoglutarate ferredoxin oxidoreductase subunit delta
MNFRIDIDRERCKGCVLCVSECSQAVLRIAKDLNTHGFHFAEVVAGEECTGCRRCVDICPEVAVGVTRCQERRPPRAQTGREPQAGAVVQERH